MRKILYPMLVCVLLALASGCANPRNEWAAARETLTQVELSLVTANQTGLLPDKDFVATEGVVKAARAGLAEADRELTANGDKPTARFRYYLNVSASVLREVQKYLTPRK